MPMVPVSQLGDGMVLAQDVFDAGGALLFGSGIAITEKHRVLLAMRKIDKVRITEESYALSELANPAPNAGEGGSGHAVAPDTAIIQNRLLRLAYMFNEHKNDPLMRELCRLAIKCTQEGIVRA